MIRIKSKKAGFRRCGVAHADRWTEYPDDRFSAEQIAVLKAEPMLVVECVKDPTPPPVPVVDRGSPAATDGSPAPAAVFEPAPAKPAVKKKGKK